MELLPSSSVKSLIALGQRRSAGGSEFESVRLDLVRRQLGAMASDPASEPLSSPELRSFEDLTRKNKQAGDAALLGWHSYSQKNWSAAQWFKQAMDWERLPKAAEGYALALRQQGMILEAEAVAYE
jgi:cellulose synthase operon protein C